MAAGVASLAAGCCSLVVEKLHAHGGYLARAMAADQRQPRRFNHSRLIPMTVYQELIAAGCQIDNHESDLYVKVTPESRAIVEPWLSGYACKHQVKTFRSNIDGEIQLSPAVLPLSLY
jgi:hypothetical protein